MHCGLVHCGLVLWQLGGLGGVRTGPVGADMETGGIQMSGLATGDIWAHVRMRRLPVARLLIETWLDLLAFTKARAH